VDSCQQCSSCAEGLEQYCDNGFVGTYNGHAFGGSENTYGGYSDNIVVRQEFVLHIRHKENLAAVAPLLCAGITTYSPLRHWSVSAGQKVGVVGLGGLGHMAVKIARAMGAHVVLITTSPDKRADALRLGAQGVIVSRDEDQQGAAARTRECARKTQAAPHDRNALRSLQTRYGTKTLVREADQPHPSREVFQLIFRRRKLDGSLVGGLAEARHMLD